jgi:hypothetical protein
MACRVKKVRNKNTDIMLHSEKGTEMKIQVTVDKAELREEDHSKPSPKDPKITSSLNFLHNLYSLYKA